ncbi:hypothetical protein KI387_036097, partial [Taxus chinensis]
NTLTMDKATEGLIAGGSNDDDTATYSIVVRSTYVPPSLMGVMDHFGNTMSLKKDENYDRVNNIFEDTMDADLHELFKPFGHITHVYVAMDQNKGVNKEFGFVNFVKREDAERAINKLNGYGYDNLILRVKWATHVVFF